MVKATLTFIMERPTKNKVRYNEETEGNVSRFSGLVRLPAGQS